MSRFRILARAGLIALFTAAISCSDETTNPPPPSCTDDTVIDIDGNVYNTVAIGSQCWLKENLKTTRYRNGDSIATGLDQAQWAAVDTGAYAVYEDDPANDAALGKLYNWHAANDPRGLCPEGWHVPSDQEWQTLELALGMPAGEVELLGWRGSSKNVGGKLKSVASWDAPNEGANNDSEFTALAGGYRVPGGAYALKGQFAGFWTSSRQTQSAYQRYLGFDSQGVDRGILDLNYGYSCRCIKDQ